MELLSLLSKARELVFNEADRLRAPLEALSHDIHSHPELCFEEVHAHESLCNLLEANEFKVTRHAYGLKTSFEAEIGTGARIGHACGHNLIAMSSMAAFVAAAKATVDLGIAGRVRILGTPAEEGGGGKIKLLDAGAFQDPGIAAAIMSHPLGGAASEAAQRTGHAGVAGPRLNAVRKLGADFHGKPAHAGAAPWNGVNALDAAVAAYSNVSMMRQQIQPGERIHGIITDGGMAPNIIPAKASLLYAIRSMTNKSAQALMVRVKACFEAAAIATGCQVEYKPGPVYKDLRANMSLSSAYVEEMTYLDAKFMEKEDTPSGGATDMGNISYAVPSFHCTYNIPSGAFANHTPEFTAAAAKPESHRIALDVGKGLAMLGIRLLLDEGLCERARKDFESDLE